MDLDISAILIVFAGAVSLAVNCDYGHFTEQLKDENSNLCTYRSVVIYIESDGNSNFINNWL